MNIKIITADSSHAAIVSLIGRQSFRDAFGHLFKSKTELQEYLDYTYDIAKITKSIEKENNVFFLAFVENVPVALQRSKSILSMNKLIPLRRWSCRKFMCYPTTMEAAQVPHC